MGVLSDRQIENLVVNKKMIDPFFKSLPYPGGEPKKQGTISRGLTSFGYDVTLGWKFKVPTPHKCRGAVLNPKNPDPTAFEEIEREPGDTLIVPAGSLVLGESVETFDIPDRILVVCLGKSTYARNGIILNVTPGEPGWRGKWTIEISNTCDLPVVVFPGEGIMQCLFLRGEESCMVSYAAKSGKYQNQSGLTLSTGEK
jgi:dCTP deaminase